MNTTQKHLPTWIARTLAVAATLGALTLLPASPSLAEPSPDDEQTEVEASERGVVNLNTATEAELGRLPGVGPTRAQAILQARERLGGFQHVRQIVFVRGIGRATYRKLRPMLTLEGPTTLK